MHRRGHRLGHELRRAGVRVVRLDNHRAAGGQSRGGVTAGGGERQGEVARPEDRHWPDRHVHLPQIRTRQRPPLRLRRVDPHLVGVPPPYDVGEHPQLAGGARAFGLQAGGWKAGLGTSAQHQVALDRLDLGRNAVQEVGALLRRAAAIVVERIGRGLGRELDLNVADHAEHRLQRLPG